jgi:predicted NACHT family NTPase
MIGKMFFDGWLDEMAEKSGLELIHDAHKFEPIYDWAEAKTILDRYRDKFGDPKMKPNIAVRIYRKP